MNSLQNANLVRLKRQLNKNTNVNLLYKKPVKKSTTFKKIIKKVNKPKTKSKVLVTKNKTVNFSNTDNSTVWTFMYVILTISILFFIALLLFNLYKEYLYSLLDQTNDINLDNQVTKAPKGVIINQEGAQISVEKSGDITENKYLTLYGGDDFMKRKSNNSSSVDNSPYSSYPDSYNGYSGNNGNNEYSGNNGYGGYSEYNGYSGYSGNGRNLNNSDDGVTKIYYELNMTGDRKKLNDYIEQQNNYIKNINERVQQINKSRMYTPEYAQDMASLSQIRNYERRIANQVNRESKSQPYLPDQVNYY
jgi:hypothetical protein